MSGCESCRELQEEWSIRSPGELSKAIRVVRANLADGTLLQRGGSDPFASLPEGGPWPDHVSFCFHCAQCGAAFTLSAETHHGAGGRWAPE